MYHAFTENTNTHTQLCTHTAHNCNISVGRVEASLSCCPPACAINSIQVIKPLPVLSVKIPFSHSNLFHFVARLSDNCLEKVFKLFIILCLCPLVPLRDHWRLPGKPYFRSHSASLSAFICYAAVGVLLAGGYGAINFTETTRQWRQPPSIRALTDWH